MDLLNKLFPSIYARLVVDLAEQQGVPREKVLAGTGFTAAELDDPKGQISFEQQLKIYHNADRLSPRSDNGLVIGMQEKLNHHGVWGYAIMSSADFAQALKIIVRYYSLSGGPFSATLDTTESSYLLHLSPIIPLGSLARFLTDEFLAALYTALNQITPDKFRYQALRIALPRPEDGERYETLFGCPVSFGCDTTQILIDRSWGPTPLETSDPQTADLCSQHCDRMLRELNTDTDFADMVHRAILQLPTHRRHAEQVADLLDISPRHLRRKLSEFGTTFKAVLDQVRRELAQDYLRHSTFSIEDITPLLGFTEATNFRRAFKKWTGQSPSEYRQQANLH